MASVIAIASSNNCHCIFCTDRKKVSKKSNKKATKESEETTEKPGKNDTKPPTTPYYSTIAAYTPPPHKNPDATPYYTPMIPPCYATTSQHKKPVTAPYYITMTSPRNAPSPYSHLQHHNTPIIAPIKRSTSDNCLNVYEKICPQHQKNENNYENLKPNTQVELHHK